MGFTKELCSLPRRGSGVRPRREAILMWKPRTNVNRWVLYVGTMTVVPKPAPDEVARRCLKFFRHVKNLIVRGGQKVSNRCMHFCWKGVFEIAIVELNRRVGPLQHGSHHSAAMFVSRP